MEGGEGARGGETQTTEKRRWVSIKHQFAGAPLEVGEDGGRKTRVRLSAPAQALLQARFLHFSFLVSSLFDLLLPCVSV